MTFLNVLKKEAPLAKTNESVEQGTTTSVYYVQPRYRIHESDTSFLVEVDMPSVSKKELEVTLQDGVLEIAGSRRASVPEGWRQLGGASDQGVTYRLRLAIGDEVNGEGIKADLENGVLRLTLPKAEEKKPRQIEIN